MSNTDSVLKKLLRKPPAIAAISIIILTVIVAVLAYILAPDNTPNANRMIVELGARQPGFEKQLLLIPKATVTKGNKLTNWLYGTPP